MQMTSFLQTAIVFLLLTNMISALVAFYAMKAAQIRRSRSGTPRSSASCRLCSAATEWRRRGGGAMTGA